VTGETKSCFMTIEQAFDELNVKGQPHQGAHQDAGWVTAHGPELIAEDVELALEAVGRVAGEESELAELWDDADEPEWSESLDELSERLRAALR